MMQGWRHGSDDLGAEWGKEDFQEGYSTFQAGGEGGYFM